MSDGRTVKVGDRFTHGDHRITITKVGVGHDGNPMIEYTVLDATTKATWASRTRRIPNNWTFTGSEPLPIQTCVGCGIDDAEPGQLYCFECVVQYANGWSGVQGDDAARMARTLIDDAEKERAER